MALQPKQQLEEVEDNHGSDLNTTSTDELASFSRIPGEMMVIRTLRRFIEPIFVPIFRPLIRQLVEDRIGLAQQEILASTKENPADSYLKKLKLQFRNKISLPVYTGKPLLGENKTTIKIALVDALNGQIVKTGPESMIKFEIVGFRVGDDERNDDLTFEDFQRLIMSDTERKHSLQGDTYLQLKEGVCLVSKISFTQTAENTKKGWYRLGAGVVDVAFMNQVEVAWTEAFLMRDARVLHSEKHPHPSLSDKVCHLREIRYKGPRYKHLEDAGVITVKDLLILFYTDPKRLEHILKLKASSKIWDEIVKHAQASNGMFVYLDSSGETKNGVVLNAKLELKGLIVETRQYITVNRLSEKQKVDAQKFLMSASEHVKMLHSFEDETSLQKSLQLGTGFTSLLSANQSLRNSKIPDEPPRPSSHVTCSLPGLTKVPNSLNNMNLHMGQSLNRAPIIASQSERGKEAVPFDDETILSPKYYQEPISSYPPTLGSPSELNVGTAAKRHAHDAAEAGTSSQVAGSLLDACGHMKAFDSFSERLEVNSKYVQEVISYVSKVLTESPNNECPFMPANSDAVVVKLAAQKRWTNVSKLLRRNSVRERIGLSEGVQAHKKQRCC